MPGARGWKALAGREKQPRNAPQANFSADRSQRKAGFLGEESEPSLCGGCDERVELTDKTVLDVDDPIADRDRGIAGFRSSRSGD
jgi:hypothetical protein